MVVLFDHDGQQLEYDVFGGFVLHNFLVFQQLVTAASNQAAKVNDKI